MLISLQALAKATGGALGSGLPVCRAPDCGATGRPRRVFGLRAASSALLICASITAEGSPPAACLGILLILPAPAA